MKSTFLAWIFRMPLIRRWSLMYSHKPENIAEHSHQVAVVAHMLAVIKNTLFDGNLQPEKAATLALYHEIAECWTSDVASPVKYSDPALTKEFKKLEVAAEIACLKTLPKPLQGYFEELLVSEKTDPVYKDIVKAADIICAYIKARDELRFNNTEFEHVKTNLESKLSPFYTLPEVEYFMTYFIDACVSTLDDLTRESPLNPSS